MSEDATTNICGECAALSKFALTDSKFFVRRPCPKCGQATYLYDKDPKTSGMRVLEGDQVMVNFQLLMKDMKLVGGGGQFSQAGLDMFVRSLLFPQRDVVRKPKTELLPILEAWAAKAEEVLKSSPRLKEFDLDTEEGANGAAELIGKQTDLAEFSALILDIACDSAKKALDAEDAWSAAGAAAMASAAHAMLVYKTDIERAVWRGHSVETLRTALTTWENNRLNDDEEFWQQTLTSYSFVLSQVFSTPVLLIAGKAYVGGKSVENTGGNLSDFLLTNAFTARTCIVELKVPTTLLLAKTPYRNGIYAPSSELVGAVAQVSGYAASLAEDASLRLQSSRPLEPARSECVVVIGTAETELTDPQRRRSFELYRSELRNVRVVTFDEVFHRVAALLALFGG